MLLLEWLRMAQERLVLHRSFDALEKERPGVANNSVFSTRYLSIYRSSLSLINCLNVRSFLPDR